MASDVRVTPVLSVANIGRVTIKRKMKSATTNGFLQMSKTITGITTTNHARRLRWSRGMRRSLPGKADSCRRSHGVGSYGSTGKSEPSLRSARQRTRIGFQEANLRFVLIVTAGDFAHD
jgi:hypothetical protein